eukprot:g35431.t1
MVANKQLTGGGRSTNVPILDDGKAQHISVKDKAEIFIAIFSQKCQVDDPSQFRPVVPSITDTSCQPIQFIPCNIRKWLEILDTTKGMGHNNIPAMVLKTCAPEPATPRAKLFRYSYSTGIYPTGCKLAQ